MINLINVLDKNTINMISAGEVVEKPASIVKELIENSIDAQSDSITVEIKEGGIKYIRVTDDGIGIDESQLDKVFLRHSTSKLSSIDDLSTLNTNGFRGEALAAISSVSKVYLISKYSDAQYAYKLAVEESEIISKEAIAGSQGTTLIVEDIFYNTPARKKFLKATSKETNEIIDLVMKLSVSNSSIKFKLIVDSKNILQTLGDGDIFNTIKNVYGKNISLNLIEISEEIEENIFLTGFISTTSGYSSTKKNQIIQINSRIVKVSPLFSKLEFAYKNLIPIRKHPNYFLNIKIDASKIDANVHPAKLEVKIENSSIIEDRIYRTIKNNIFKSYSNMIPNITNDIHLPKITGNNNDTSSHRYDYSLISLSKNEVESTNDMTSQVKSAQFYKENINPNIITNQEIGIIAEKEKTYASEQEIIQFKQKNNLDLDMLVIIGRVFGTYIIALYEEKMYYIDQHAAHERVLFEKYMNQYKNQHIQSQILIVPQILELNTEEYQIFLENMELINSFGYKTEGFGNKTIVIREVPALFSKTENENFLLEILNEVKLNTCITEGEYYKEKLALMACKAAINANYNLKEIEAKELLKKLNKCENKFTCPHGRPIFLELTKRDIEVMFKRII